MYPVHTIGYSGIEIFSFIELLLENECNVVCDVRSFPNSRYRPEFSRRDLKKHLNEHRIKYAFFGDSLGARPNDRACYQNGRAHYSLIAAQDSFKQAVRRLANGANSSGLALVCSEADPIECHRAILVSRHLSCLAPDVRHIHSSGQIETHAELEDRLIDLYGTAPPPLLRTEAERKAGLIQAYEKQGEAISYSETEQWKKYETLHDRIH